jgi:hypothetical protein
MLWERTRPGTSEPGDGEAKKQRTGAESSGLVISALGVFCSEGQGKDKLEVLTASRNQLTTVPYSVPYAEHVPVALTACYSRGPALSAPNKFHRHADNPRSPVDILTFNITKLLQAHTFHIHLSSPVTVTLTR